MEWARVRSRTLRLPTSYMGTHTDGLLEPQVRATFQRSGVWSRLGGQPAPGQGAVGGPVRPPDGRAAAERRALVALLRSGGAAWIAGCRRRLKIGRSLAVA